MNRRRSRGRSYVRTELKLHNFSKDEDELILKLHALLGNRWSLIAGRLPGRTDKEVMIHWETYLKKKLIKMGIDPTNHRLYHHSHYMTRRHLNSSHKQHETSDQSSSSSESKSCDMIASANRLPDLNISLVPIKTVTRCLEDDSDSSHIGSRSQETLLLFQ